MKTFDEMTMCDDNPTSMHYLYMEARMEAYDKSREIPGDSVPPPPEGVKNWEKR